MANGWENTKGQKCLIFIMVPELRITNDTGFAKK